jgi:uncharacterized protein (PEP-CTERM system associated)
VGALAVPVSVCGANWTNSISTTLRQTYTDNTDLTDNNKDDDWITSVTPGISVRGEGARMALDFNYALNGNHHTGGDRTTSFNHRLQTSANTELADKWLFLDARATYTQTLIDEYQSSGGDTVNNSGNTENTFTWEVSPSTSHRLGRYAEARTRVRYNEVKNTTSSDSRGVAANANLQSGRFFQDTLWSVDYSYVKDFDYGSGRGNSEDVRSGGNDIELKSLYGSVERIFSRRWRVQVGAGREWNDFSSTRSDEDGMRWDASVRWTPSARTLIRVGYSDRFYGSNPTLDFSHESRRSVWTGSYRKDLSTARQQRLENQVYATEDAFGNPIADPVNGDPLDINPDLADSNADIFVNEVFQTSYTLATRRTTVTANLRYSERQYQDSSRDNTTTRIGLSLNRALSGVTSLDTNVSWERFTDDQNPTQDENREHDTWTAGLGLTHTLTQRTNVALNYRFRHRDSDVRDDDYTENRLSLFLTTSWQ